MTSPDQAVLQHQAQALEGHSAQQSTRLDHSVFDADIHGQAMNLQYLGRILSWAKPHARIGVLSIAFVLLAATLTVLLPVLIGRVVIDGILFATPTSTAPDFGLMSVTLTVSHWLDSSTLVGACLVFIVMTLLCHGLYHAHRILLSRTVLNALRDLRHDLFAHMERRPAAFYDKVAVGRVMTRITNDIQALFDLLMGVGMLAGEFVPFFLALIVMFSIDVTLTLWLLIAVPVFAVFTLIFRRATRRVYRDIRSSVSQLNQYLQENLSGIQIVQLSNREQRNLNTYSEINRTNQTQEISAIRMETTYGAFMDNMVNLALALILWVGGQSVLKLEMTLGSVVLFTQFVDMFIRPIRVMGQQYNVLFRAMASAERIFQALDWPERITEPEAPHEPNQRLRGELQFNRLNFGYQPDHPVIKNFTLSVSPGEKLAVVGPTGSGKSTLIRLLVRFYDVDDGMIYLDGIDINRYRSETLRQRIGVVLQDFHIFSGSILDNIRLGNPKISRQDAIRAADAVHATPFIERLEAGFDTPLNERGQNLSQGERQLLAFARVLAADPEILILDEATASIDTKTEAIVQSALETLMQGRTSIIIAHRLQTIRSADRILVLKHGETRELGTHEQLMAQRGIYYTLTQLQFQDVIA
ncbi:MAG: ABC transporter ATP-binding protein [Pseudomonadales bacterium]|jgi:ATP-binding cassette subfamily B multidrug efflux pump